MNKILTLILITFSSVLYCEAQNDTVIYYGPNGVITTESNAIEYIRVESGKKKKKKKKKKAQNYRLWTYNKYNGKWNEPVTYEELRQENDSTYLITNVSKKKSIIQIKRVVKKIPSGFYIRDYTPNGQLAEDGYSKSIFPLHKLGQYRSYYSDGSTKKVSAYSENEEIANENWDKNGEKTLDNVFSWADSMPEFEGGEQGLLNYLAKNIVYAQFAKENGIQGIVYISFVIMEDGTINQINMLRGIGGGCDEESLKVVRDMPKWNPGTHKGKPVRVLFNLPIRFVLR